MSARLSERGVATNIAWQGNRDVFKRNNRVTISLIHRTKGNEAAQVYVLNLEAVYGPKLSQDYEWTMQLSMSMG